jgi:hypothetical protein
MGGIFGITKRLIYDLKLKWIECAKVYGTDPWLDYRPIEDISDEELPLWATEI